MFSKFICIAIIILDHLVVVIVVDFGVDVYVFMSEKRLVPMLI